jgi:predicted TIM-barrel fold metal-dependent hydrolase
MVLEMRTIASPVARVIPDLGPDLPAGTVVVSADEHSLEVEHLWEERLPSHFRDRAPRLWRDEVGFHSEFMGKQVDHVPSEDRPGMYDLEARIKDQAAEGIQKSLLFPQRSLQLVRVEDQALRAACLQAYNEWLAAYLAPYGGRFYGVALLNWWDGQSARDNIEAIKSLGFKAMAVPMDPRDILYNDPALEPLWAAAEEFGIPISIHVGENLRPDPGAGGVGVNFLMTLSGHHFRRLFGLLTYSGVFERHPDLRVVFTEGGLGWVASALFEADKIYRDFDGALEGRDAGHAFEVDHSLFQKPARPPSHYWFQNCYATFQEDPPGLKLLDDIGWDRVMWASDYPHRESTLGHSRRAVRDVFDATTVEKAQAVVGGTATKLWGLN